MESKQNRESSGNLNSDGIKEILLDNSFTDNTSLSDQENIQYKRLKMKFDPQICSFNVEVIE